MGDTNEVLDDCGRVPPFRPPGAKGPPFPESLMMSFARAASVFALVCALCACSGRGDEKGPVLPAAELPSTTVGLPYEVSLAATGGVPPLSYTVGAVPPGFSFYTG